MGVAGGVNVYRFNNGNPVSFGDPFGLCPEWLDGKPCDLNALASFAAGFGDAVSFGLTDVVRDKMGTNGVVDKDGAAYFGGQVGAVIAGAALGSAAAGVSRAATGTGGAKNSANAARLGKQLSSEEGVAEILNGGGKVIAGSGSDVPLRDVGRLIREYGGSPEQWIKVTSTAERHLQTHAYRNTVTGQVVELKSILP